MSMPCSMAIFDTHAHLDLEPFADDFDAVLERIETGRFPDGFDQGVTVDVAGVLMPGIDAASSGRCVALAERSSKLYAATAIHPNSTGRAGPEDWETIRRLARRDDVIAIGETGLDRYWDHSPLDVQVDFLERHLMLARETDKPVLIHCRDAWDDLLPILRKYFTGQETRAPGVIHAFSGTPEQAEESLRLGFFVSFAGSLTYRNAKFAPLWEAAKVVPRDRLLIETDAPFMPPHPFRGKLSRNEPVFATWVAKRLAELRGESARDIAAATTRNARRFLGMAEPEYRPN